MAQASMATVTSKIIDLFNGESSRIGIVVGTGPSLTDDMLGMVNYARTQGKVRLFGCNNTIFSADLDVHHACNYQWHDYYAEETRHYPCYKWTTRPEVPRKFPWINYIEERWIPGLSIDKSYIAAHHGTGPQVVNLALHYGCKKILLVGWDMRHKGKRHYFGDGEYPEPLQHFTRNLGPDGELIGLIQEMETIKPEDYGVEIINCSQGSAMQCFPFGDLKTELGM